MKTSDFIKWCASICFLIVKIIVFQNNIGILAMLDEECMLPGNVTDNTFLHKLNVAWKDHPHYESRALRKNQSDKNLPHDAFRLKHYAGSVSWLKCSSLNFVCFQT